MTFSTRFVALLALASAQLSCGGSGAPDEPQLLALSASVPSSVGRARWGYTAAEFMDADAVEAALPLLAAHDVDLVWAFHADDSPEETQKRFGIVGRAAEMGVEIRPWLLLAMADGYFPGSANAALFADYARTFMQQWVEAGLEPNMLLVDMEMPIETARRFVELANQSDVLGTVNFLRSKIDREQYAAATEIYKQLVDDAHAQGWKSEISTLQVVFDDMDDGDDGIRQGMTIPFDGIDWDLCTFQIYRTVANAGIGMDLNASYVWDYALRIKLRFGDRAGVIVGINDASLEAVPSDIYANPKQAGEDVEAGRMAGIAREWLGLYQLKGIVEQPPEEAWFERSPARLLNPADPATMLVKSAGAAIDLLM